MTMTIKMKGIFGKKHKFNNVIDANTFGNTFIVKYFKNGIPTTKGVQLSDIKWRIQSGNFGV